MSLPLIVSGATGKQGGALIAALLASSPSHSFKIYAVTRNKSSSGARKLASQPNVQVIEGDFDKPEAIFEQVDAKPWGLFSVTTPMGRGGAKKEEMQGKAVTKVALEAGAKHIVFASVQRGPDGDDDPTVVPHFASKKHIEDDIKEKMVALDGRTWTFLRPVAFMDNFTNDLFGKIFVATWRLNGNETRLQFISTKDIGRIAADAFLSLRNNPETSPYRNQSIALAGDTISPISAARTFHEVTGEELPLTYPLLVSLTKWMMKDDLGIMMDWFRDVGYSVDVHELKKRYPFLKNFREWLEEESAWRKT